MEKMEKLVRRGDLYYLDFGITVGSEQNGVRPVIVVSNKMANRYSPTILVSPITSRFSKKELPTHVKLNHRECGLNRESQVLLEQIYTVDKSRLGTYIGSADRETMDKIDIAAEISIQVGDNKEDRRVKALKEMLQELSGFDKFINMWKTENSDMNPIKTFLNQREIKWKEILYFCQTHNLELINYIHSSGDENLYYKVG